MRLCTHKMVSLPCWLIFFVTAIAGAYTRDELPTARQVAKDLGFTERQIKRVLDGDIVSTDIRETSDNELAIAIAMLTPTSVDELTDGLRANFLLTSDETVLAFGEIPGEQDLEMDQVVEALGEISYTDDEAAEVRMLLRVTPGSTFNLSQAEVDLVRAVSAAHRGRNAERAPEARQAVGQVYREMLVQRFLDYRTLGPTGIKPYHRGRSNHADVQEELTSAVEAEKRMSQYVPEFYDALVDFPENQPDDVRHQFLWVKQEVEGRPCFILKHRMIHRSDRGLTAADRQYYVGSSYNSMQILYGALPTKAGTIVFYTNHTFTDQVSGLGSRLKRGIGRRMMADEVRTFFSRLRPEAGRN